MLWAVFMQTLSIYGQACIGPGDRTSCNSHNRPCRGGKKLMKTKLTIAVLLIALFHTCCSNLIFAQYSHSMPSPCLWWVNNALYDTTQFSVALLCAVACLWKFHMWVGIADITTHPWLQMSLLLPLFYTGSGVLCAGEPQWEEAARPRLAPHSIPTAATAREFLWCPASSRPTLLPSRRGFTW